jgi:hypothetical protein
LHTATRGILALFLSDYGGDGHGGDKQRPRKPAPCAAAHEIVLVVDVVLGRQDARATLVVCAAHVAAGGAHQRALVQPTVGHQADGNLLKI